jgi:hypothetical protein
MQVGCIMSDNGGWNEQLLLALGEAIRATTQVFQEALRVMAEDNAQAVAAAPPASIGSAAQL